jgi:hypothetical protein
MGVSEEKCTAQAAVATRDVTCFSEMLTMCAEPESETCVRRDDADADAVAVADDAGVVAVLSSRSFSFLRLRELEKCLG